MAGQRPTEEEIAVMRHNLARREVAEKEWLRKRLERARRDADAVIDHVSRRYNPRRIYQWGSLVRGDHFSERSDIDIAVEGLDRPEAVFRILEDAENMTDFPVDIVELEKIAPEYAEGIRRRGVLRYER